ncbi:hypothetical protein [Actinomadura keratinilytica]|uniref:Uncharacterized protein n=1 Tax=Actinomadura keratinilytica TaxID=547461 RepID=A0ABP7Z4P2_9ACTN
MNGGLAAQHGRLQDRVDSVMLIAMRADVRAIHTVAGDGRADWQTRTFVREARRLTLGCAAGLSAVLDRHRPGTDPYGHEVCRACGTSACSTLKAIADVFAAYAVRPAAVDRAEAWRRADAYLGSRGVPLVIEEFAEGFVARPVPGGNGLLVVDRATGALTRWPDLPTAELVERYRHYLRGAP